MSIRSDDVSYVQQQYQDDLPLRVRIHTHATYTVPQVDFTAWVLNKIGWQGTERVIDIGVGAGIYVEPVRARCRHYIAADLSLGMLHRLPQPNLDRLNLDVQRLPLPDHTFDVVLANHMLYHVPDRDAALDQIARILRPAGCLLAVTNSVQSMGELTRLYQSAAHKLGLIEKIAVIQSAADTFGLENGTPLLLRHFAHVARFDLPAALVFPEPQPVIDYIATTRERYEALLPAGITWADVVAALTDLLRQHIAEHGVFRVNKLTGVFVCRHPQRKK